MTQPELFEKPRDFIAKDDPPCSLEFVAFRSLDRTWEFFEYRFTISLTRFDAPVEVILEVDIDSSHSREQEQKYGVGAMDLGFKDGSGHWFEKEYGTKWDVLRAKVSRDDLTDEECRIAVDAILDLLIERFFSHADQLISRERRAERASFTRGRKMTAEDWLKFARYSKNDAFVEATEAYLAAGKTPRDSAPPDPGKNYFHGHVEFRASGFFKFHKTKTSPGWEK